MKLNPDGRTVAAMDVLVPKVGELIGGSQREDRWVAWLFWWWCGGRAG
jgi:aspartyl/asparaginyl-tRNA synthetase